MKEIIEQNNGLIRSIIKKITGSYNEDIEQEVYIKTWRNLQNYKESGKLKSWIATITVNLCKDYFRSSLYKQQQNEISNDILLTNRTTAATQEKIIDRKHRQKLILKAVDSLPTKLRKVIILFEFEDMTIPQIAKKLHQPEGTIKSRLFNARKILSQKLKPLLQGEQK